VNLSAVGRVRIFPLTCPGRLNVVNSGTDTTPPLVSAPDEYRAIVAKLTPPTPTASTSTEDEKRLLKECVKLCSHYLRQTLGLDVSIINVEIVIDIATITNTNGRIANCLLDAGCAYIVIPVEEDDPMNSNSNNNYLDMAINACNVTLVPRERLIVHYSTTTFFGRRIHDIENIVGTISLQFTLADVDLVASSMIPLLCNNDSKTKIIISLTMDEGSTIDEKEEDIDDMDFSLFPPPVLTTAIQTLAQAIGQSNLGYITLIDPSPLQLGSAYISCLTTDRSDNLYPTVVCTRNNEALGLVYSNKESIIAALTSGQGVYYSRSRAGVWHKGKTSGHTQILHRIDADCDGDALRFTVTQMDGFCHLNTLSCWGEPRGIRHLEETLIQRLTEDAPEGSYTKRLFNDDTLLRNKLVEEAQELSEAVTKDHVTEELADVLYFALVRAVKAGVSIDDAVAELDRRARKVTRRPGDSKEYRIKAGEEILGKSKK
jgi:phosphoribosyl-ATP pyrophosphohydrolase/phosphoribosyl-AMP cyclohydrolase/histidinol dehydrogenase